MRADRATTAATAAVEAVLVYVAFFAWDRSTEINPDTGSTSGPYDTWQVVLATLALGLLAYAGGRARRAWLSALAISVAFTAAWSVDAATATTEGANLWPIGAVLTFIGTLLLTLLVAHVTQRRTHKPVSAGDWH